MVVRSDVLMGCSMKSASGGNTEFGYSPDNPIAVAGGNVFGPMNERAYLDRLRGPGGSVLRYQRTGYTFGAAHTDPIDVNHVECQGLPEPVKLHFDIYSPGPEGVPKGFTLQNPLEPWNLPTSIILLQVDDASIGETGPISPPEPFQNAPPSQPKEWLIFQSDNKWVGFATWTGKELELHLPATLRQAIKERTDHYLGLVPPSRVSEFVNDYFERALVISSKGQLRAALHPEIVLPHEPPTWGQGSITRTFHIRIGIWCTVAGCILLRWQGLI